MDITTSSSFPWSEIVEPPTIIRPAPKSAAFRAVLTASSGEKSSGSIRAAQIVPFLVFLMRADSTGPIEGKSSTDAGVVVYEGVVDVDVGSLGRVPHLPAGVQRAAGVSARYLEDGVM